VVVLANGQGGGTPIDAVVQQWVVLATSSCSAEPSTRAGGGR
jgi:hypothetical protein